MGYEKIAKVVFWIGLVFNLLSTLERFHILSKTKGLLEKGIDMRIFLEIGILIMVIISGVIILNEKYVRFKRRIDDIAVRVKHLEDNPATDQGEGHLIDDPTRKKKDELFKRILTGSQ